MSMGVRGRWQGAALAGASLLGLLGAAGCAPLPAPRSPIAREPIVLTPVAILPAAPAGSGSAGTGATPPPPEPLSPFSDAPVSFLIHGQFSRGELVIVRVCVRADHSIASSQVIESSGDPHFDELAVDWARRVRLRAHPADGLPTAPCGAVRVELHSAPEPKVIPGPENLLG